MYLVKYSRSHCVEVSKIDRIYRSIDGSLWFAIGGGHEMVDREVETSFLDNVKAVNQSSLNAKIELTGD